MWESLQTSFIKHFNELIHMPVDASARIYWVYLFGALLLAWAVFWRSSQNQSLGHFCRFVFAKKIWLHDSAKMDYKLWLVNKLLFFPLILPFALGMVSTFYGVTNALEWGFGNMTPFVVPEAVLFFSFTLALFIVDDLSRFLLHLGLHKIPWLWQFHKVHHSAEVLTPFTIYRSHPVENFLYSCRAGLSQGIVIGVFYYLFGSFLSAYDVAGANIFTFLFNVLGSNLRHSHIWISWGQSVEKWFISPAQHQVHHSAERQYFDKNFGAFLSIWDRWYGSLVLAPKTPVTEWGISNAKDLNQSLWHMYKQPFLEILKSVTHKNFVAKRLPQSSRIDAD